MKFKNCAIAIACILTTSLLPANAATQNTITRNDVETRALNMINYKWSYSATNNTKTDSPLVVTKPTQLGTTSETQTGIPYCWGGFDSLDTASYQAAWKNFGEAVSQGAYTGNTNDEAGLGYISGTAGLDCSGFVQSAFNIKDYKQSTSTLLSNYFTQINMSDIQHMDILIAAGSHVAIFDSWGYNNSVYGAYTYESTTNTFYGGIQGTKKYFMSMNYINQLGYVAAKYKYLASTASFPAKTVATGIFAKTTDNVNLRTSASTLSSIVTLIPGNSVLYVDSYSNGWYKVFYNGNSGWVYGQYLTYLPSGTYVTIKNVTQLNIRSSYSALSPILGSISVNQYAKVLGYSPDGKWMKITINNITGWSSAAYLSYIY